MRFGWVQGSSAHMWEICNRPGQVAGDRWRHPCARRADGKAYVQLRHLDSEIPTMALAWATHGCDVGELLDACRGLARPLGVGAFSVTVLERDEAELASLAESRRGCDEVWSRSLRDQE